MVKNAEMYDVSQEAMCFYAFKHQYVKIHLQSNEEKLNK